MDYSTDEEIQRMINETYIENQIHCDCIEYAEQLVNSAHLKVSRMMSVLELKNERIDNQAMEIDSLKQYQATLIDRIDELTDSLRRLEGRYESVEAQLQHEWHAFDKQEIMQNFQELFKQDMEEFLKNENEEESQPDIMMM